MKLLTLIITTLCSTSLAQASEQCVPESKLLDPSAKHTTQELLQWIDSSRKAAECLGIERMSDSFNELEESVRAKDVRKTQAQPGQACKVSANKETISETKPFHPNATYRNANGLLWKKPYYDEYGEMMGFDESILLTMRPDHKDINNKGRIYVAFSGQDSTSFLGADNQWQQTPKVLACSTAGGLENAHSTSESHRNQSDSISQSIEGMSGLSDELKKQLLTMPTSTTGRKPRTGNALPACPEGYEPPDTTPQPYSKDKLNHAFHLHIPLGRDAKWCPDSGPHNLYVGYGVLSASARREIENQMVYGNNAIAQMEAMIIEAKQGGDNSPTSQYWLSQMEKQLPIFRAQAQKIQYQARAGITENRLVYQNGYQQQTCWQVFSYNCPSISEDL